VGWSEEGKPEQRLLSTIKMVFRIILSPFLENTANLDNEMPSLFKMEVGK
jgi:hypothetical protein